MKPLTNINDQYFEQFPEKPVAVEAFDPKLKIIAKQYLEEILNPLIENLSLKGNHVGSTALGIAGRREIELAIYTPNETWNKLLVRLINHYKSIGNLDTEYARFDDKFEGEKIEVICLKGYSAKVNLKVFNFLKGHEEIKKQYENLKLKFSFSKKAYKIQQNKFFEKIIKEIPDEEH